MVIVALLLAVAFTVICVVEYNQSVAEVYKELDSALMRTGGARVDPPESEWQNAGMPAPAPDTPQPDDYQGSPFELGERDRNRRFVPVAVYESTQDGSLIAVSNIGNAALSGSLLVSAAAAIVDMPYGNGELNQLGLLYAKRDVMGRTLVAFADVSSVSSWQGLAIMLAIVGVGALAAFFVVSLAFSKWALSPVRRAWERQKRFISDASHEMKTPLTVMAANTAIVQRNAEKTVASQSQWIESTETEIAVMRELVDDMLFMASVDEGALQQEPREAIDLSRLVEAQLLQFESLAFEKGIETLEHIEEGVVVEGVRAQIDRLVRTLLDNAYKYAPQGGEVEVRLTCEKPEAAGGTQAALRPVLSVRNTGTPIAPEDLQHIFDRFYRADEARTRGTGGYGLGLSIAHDIAKAHKATLSVESNAEAGTTFTVRWD